MIIFLSLHWNLSLKDCLSPLNSSGVLFCSCIWNLFLLLHFAWFAVFVSVYLVGWLCFPALEKQPFLDVLCMSATHFFLVTRPTYSRDASCVGCMGPYAGMSWLLWGTGRKGWPLARLVWGCALCSGCGPGPLGGQVACSTQEVHGAAADLLIDEPGALLGCLHSLRGLGVPAFLVIQW